VAANNGRRGATVLSKETIEFGVIPMTLERLAKMPWEEMKKHLPDNLLAGICDGRIYNLATSGIAQKNADYKQIIVWCERRMELTDADTEAPMQWMLDDLGMEKPKDSDNE
jgi:hypothetical protein